MSRRWSTLPVASLALACACSSARAPSTTTAAQPAPAQNLVLTPTAARVGSDGKVQVDYTLSDAAGAPLAGVTDVTSSWTLATVTQDPASQQPIWKSLITAHVKGALGETDQPTAETGKGTIDDLGGGAYRYTYATALPSGYDPGATYRAGVYARRPVAGQASLNDIANAVIDFVPAGGTPQPHDAVSTQACDQCHGILQAHGGFRRETRLCATCHTTQLVDPDTHDTGDPSAMNPLDLARLVHRIHRGQDLPTVQAAAAAGDTSWKYHVIGFQGSDNVFGAVAPNPDPTASAKFVTTGVAFPQDLRSCTVCHRSGKDAQGHAYAAQADGWKTAPQVRACQACHDDSGFTSAEASATYHSPHPGGLLDDDPSLPSRCGSCHGSGTGDLDVPSLHVATTASPAFDLFKVEITSASAPSPSQPVHVAFRVLNADGSPVTDIGGFQGQTGRLAVTIAGPTTEYVAASINTVTVPAATSPTGDYAVDVPFPSGVTPTGTWSAGIEARRKNATLSTSDGTVYDFARNPVSSFAVGGGTAQPRRQVVATDRCNACHGVLSAHGSLRHDVEYCVMCHAPDNDDAAQRAAATKAGKPILDGLKARGIHFKALIHSIHTGENLEVEQPFVVYGFGGNPAFLGDVRFPGTTARCEACHLPGTWAVESVPTTAADTRNIQVTASTVDASGAVTKAGTTGSLRPVAAACLSCHDNPQAHTHVASMESSAGSQGAREDCYVCHGSGGDQSIALEHGLFTR